MELHREGSAPAACAAGLFLLITNLTPLCLIHFIICFLLCHGILQHLPSLLLVCIRNHLTEFPLPFTPLLSPPYHLNQLLNVCVCLLCRYGMVWYGMVWYGMVDLWYGVVGYGRLVVWYGRLVVWYGMVWYGRLVVQLCVSLLQL